MIKKLISILVVIILVLGMIPVNADGAEDFLIDNGVLIRYLGTAVRIVIPNGVTVIGGEVFSAKDIVSVTMPDSVTVIEDSAFSMCDSLTKVTLSQNLKSIGNGTFAGCSKLKSIKLPYGLERIGDGAFNECKSLIDMNIPATVKYISEWNMMPKEWAKNQKREFVILGDGILYKYNGYYSNSDNVVIPGNVKVIGEYAFAYDRSSTANIRSVTIPGSVKEILRGAFHQSSDKLTRVTIGEGVANIDGDIFTNCPNLNQVNIPGSLSDTSLVSYRKPWPGNKSQDFDIRGNGVLFKYKGKDAYVKIPDGVKYIYNDAFADNHTLHTVTIPESVAGIGDAAFKNCENLVKADIPNSVKSIGEWAFYNCTKLQSTRIPRGVDSIQERTFYGCSSLTQIDIPDTVDGIGKLAFAKAYSLAEVRIANGLKSIGHYAFQDCRALSGVIIPPSVTYIGNMAFQNNIFMRDVTIQDPNVRVHENTFGGNAFSGSRNIIITAPAGGSVQRMASRSEIPFNAIADGKNSAFIPRSAVILVDGTKVEVESYTVNASTYFKLRDMAAALNGTKKQFNVSWDASLGAVRLTSGNPYKAVGGELRTVGSQAISVLATTSPVYKDGRKLELFSYQIDGNNYYKLHDVMQLFDIGVAWDKDAGAISIDTSSRYMQ